jgi:hypothetical protein
MRARLAPVAGLLGAIALAPPVAVGQDRPRVVVGGEFYTVSFDSGIGTKSVSEFVVPLGVALPMGRLTLDAATYVVSARRTDDSGVSTTLEGITDVMVRAGFQLWPDVAVLTMAVNLPTGTETLTGDQLLVAGAAATDLIPFPVSTFGTALNVTTGLALAAPVGGWAVGAAGSYRYNGSYSPLAEDTATLRPGGEIRVRLGADRVVGQGRVALGVTYSTFSQDDFGGLRSSPGGRIVAQASWSFPVGNHNVALYAWDVNRSQDSSALGPALKQNTAAVGASGALRLGRSLLRPAAELRNQWQGTTSLDQYGWLLSLGARLQLALGDRFTLTPGARFDTGSLRIGGGSVGYTGFSGSLLVRASL